MTKRISTFIVVIYYLQDIAGILHDTVQTSV
jgi:hypothetical protein